MHKTCLAIAMLVVTSPAFGQSDEGKVSIASVEACKAISDNFAAVSECLPSMEIALSALSAFSEIYPAPAGALKEKCIDINTDQIGAEVCVRKAIESALSLAEALPAGASVDDPIFEAIKNRDDFEKLEQVRISVRNRLPDFSGSGVTTYKPYR